MKTLLKQLCYLSSAALLVSCASNPYTYTQSANYSHRVKFLVMHYTAIDYEKSMRALVDEGGLSSHYLLPESGDPSYPKDELEITPEVNKKVTITANITDPHGIETALIQVTSPPEPEIIMVQKSGDAFGGIFSGNITPDREGLLTFQINDQEPSQCSGIIHIIV